MWVAFTACFCFVAAGLAVALHAFVSRRAYSWFMAVLLAAMAAIPSWIAFDFDLGKRQCTSNFAYLAGEFGCRAVFGVAALLLACMLVVAVRKHAKHGDMAS
jgi:hypothetical protein